MVREDGEIYSEESRAWLNVGGHNYYKLNLVVDGRIETMFVHRIVAETYLGVIPTGYEVNHINGNTFDNRVENLEIVTQQENLQHQFENGLFRYESVVVDDVQYRNMTDVYESLGTNSEYLMRNHKVERTLRKSGKRQYHSKKWNIGVRFQGNERVYESISAAETELRKTGKAYTRRNLSKQLKDNIEIYPELEIYWVKDESSFIKR